MSADNTGSQQNPQIQAIGQNYQRSASIPVASDLGTAGFKDLTSQQVVSNNDQFNMQNLYSPAPQAPS